MFDRRQFCGTCSTWTGGVSSILNGVVRDSGNYSRVAWLTNSGSDQTSGANADEIGMKRKVKHQGGALAQTPPLEDYRHGLAHSNDIFRPGRWLALLALAFLVQATWARASVALLMEEPFGKFGAMNPTGHAAVYLNHICASSPTELRLCKPGEYGVVISRYHKIAGYDWIAIPLIPYLYAVDDASEVPTSVDKANVARLRDAYRRKYLEALAPDTSKGKAPKGEWIQLVGSSYDRTIHGFQVTSTTDQDERFIALFNDRRNVGHFNLLFHNCADFSRSVLDIYLPGAIHRSFIADLGLTTPKQVARELVKYDEKHPETDMSAFVIPQIAGSVKRSHPVKGVSESLVKSKKYLIPMTILAPELTGGMVVAYLARGRMKLPDDPVIFDADHLTDPSEATPPPAANEGAESTLIAPASAGGAGAHFRE
jgi:hypothetical protein